MTPSWPNTSWSRRLTSRLLDQISGMKLVMAMVGPSSLGLWWGSAVLAGHQVVQEPVSARLVDLLGTHGREVGSGELTLLRGGPCALVGRGKRCATGAEVRLRLEQRSHSGRDCLGVDVTGVGDGDLVEPEQLHCHVGVGEKIRVGELAGRCGLQLGAEQPLVDRRESFSAGLFGRLVPGLRDRLLMVG